MRCRFRATSDSKMASGPKMASWEMRTWAWPFSLDSSAGFSPHIAILSELGERIFAVSHDSDLAVVEFLPYITILGCPAIPKWQRGESAGHHDSPTRSLPIHISAIHSQSRTLGCSCWTLPFWGYLPPHNGTLERAHQGIPPSLPSVLYALTARLCYRCRIHF